MNFVKRKIEPIVRAMAQKYPVVTLIGPRQSGKSTLVKTTFPKKPYVNLEALDTRRLAQVDPRAFLEQLPHGAILDEIQRVPELLSYIQERVDAQDQYKNRGEFILTGSHQPSLHAEITQSLAGRTAMIRLLPFCLSETTPFLETASLEERVYMGSYPRIYRDQIEPKTFFRDYALTYVERDVRQMIQLHDLNVFQRFLKLTASRAGQVLNINGLANEVGVSNHTISQWLSILEASFLIVRVSPYFENFGKRVIKSPKIYFTDTGLLCYLLNITSAEQLSRDPLRGHLVENYIVLEMIKEQFNTGKEMNLYYYRDSNMHEIDIVFLEGGHLNAIEIKAAKTFSKHFLKGLEYFKNLTETRFGKGYIIYAGELEQRVKNFELLNYQHTAEIFENDKST